MNKLTVLHVEDEDSAAYLFRAALEEARIPVSPYRVSDGEQARLFSTGRDLIMTPIAGAGGARFEPPQGGRLRYINGDA